MNTGAKAAASGKKKMEKNPKGTFSFFMVHVGPAGNALARKLKGSLFPEGEIISFKRLKKEDSLKEAWQEARAILFIGAAGIAVRTIAPYIKSKTQDPAVVVMDEKGKNVISLLSGHEGGANRIAREIAGFLGTNPVITTATDLNGLTPVDVFAGENGLEVETPGLLPALSARHLGKRALAVYTDIDIELPDDYIKTDSPREADLLITDKVFDEIKCGFYLRPKSLVLGAGFNSGAGAEEIEDAVALAFREAGLAVASIKIIATHQKKAVEAGLAGFADKYNLPVRGFSSDELNAVSGVARSGAAMKALGAQAVSEPAAVLAAGGKDNTHLAMGKRAIGNVTVAAARAAGNRTKELFVVGLGPGGLEHLTPAAMDAIRQADAIIGYKSYLAHIEPLVKGKTIVSSAMTEEVVRAREAAELAAKGLKVCLVSGGDPGIYGMAGLAIEVAANMDPELKVRVIPGISAVNACASRLGAPLMHDFAVISLSDRLTPWETIEKRLHAAAGADMVTVIYNPKSGGRKTQIEKALGIMRKYRDGGTPVGIVTDATRDGEDALITTLSAIDTSKINMKSTVIIGNSMSRRHGGYMLTPRGYERKYAL